MEPNNFEKKVQQKMEDLKIAPSDSVWTNIEKRISKKHKERRLIYLFLFLFVVLLSGGYWFLNSSNNSKKNVRQITGLKIKESESKGNPTEHSSQPTNNPDSSLEKNNKIAEDGHVNGDKQSVSADKSTNEKFITQNKIHSKNKSKQKIFVATSSVIEKENASKQTNNEDFSFELRNEFPLPDIISDISETETHNLHDLLKGPIDLNPIDKNLWERLQKGTTTAALINISKKPSPKQSWKIGITFSGGASLIGDNILEKNVSVQDMNVSMPGGFPSGNPSYSYSPSPMKNSTAFVAGAFVEKSISEKSKISIGISYKYFSLVNKIGNRINLVPPLQYLASYNTYYSSINSVHSYRNNFHFLEVPASVKIRINKNESLPLTWNAGVNISQLMSSNAFQFNSSQGFYYKDNSLFHKTQFGLITGFSLTLFSQQRIPVSVGPYFYYSPSRLADEGLYQNKHFSFIGIQTEILFQKK